MKQNLMLKKLLEFNVNHRIILHRVGMLSQQSQRNKNLKLSKIKETILIRMTPTGPKPIKMVVKATKQEAQKIHLDQSMDKKNSSNQFRKKIPMKIMR